MLHVRPGPDRFLPLVLLLLLAHGAAATAEPLSVRDDLGRTLRFNAPPQRIVSLSPGVTEILFLLDLDHAVVGVSDFCNFPDAALSKPKVGGVNPNIEAIVALRPDLVLGTGGVGMRDTARRLEHFGIPFMGLESESVEAVLARIILLGDVTGRRDAATTVVNRLRQRLDAVAASRSTTPALRVLYLIDENPYLTIGPKSFLYDVIVKAGGRPFETGPSESYPRVGLEPIIRFDPQVIFFTGETEEIPEERITAWHRWDRISAVKAGRLYTVPRDLVNRPGPRIVDAVEFFASKLQAKDQSFETDP